MSKYVSYGDGTPVPSHELTLPIKLLCGSTGWFDHNSSIYSYRCGSCGAVVGSISMPRECKELYDMQKVVEKLRG